MSISISSKKTDDVPQIVEQEQSGSPKRESSNIFSKLFSRSKANKTMADADTSGNSKKFGYNPNTSTQPSFGAHIKNFAKSKDKDRQSTTSSQVFYTGVGLNQSMNDVSSEHYMSDNKSRKKLHKASVKK